MTVGELAFAVLDDGSGAIACSASRDWESELAAAVAATMPVALPDGPTGPAAFLLTGATGLVGAHLLAALLKLDLMPVVCLVRASSTAEGAARLAEILREVGVSGDVSEHDSPRAAYQVARDGAAEGDRIVIFGSFLTVADVLAVVKAPQ